MTFRKATIAGLVATAAVASAVGASCTRSSGSEATPQRLASPSVSAGSRDSENVPPPAAEPERSPSPFPNLQAELLDERNRTTASPLANVDFKNHTYPLPRGWQNPDGSDLVLANGKIEPVSIDTDIDMEPEELAERKARRRIGASYVATKFFDATGDGQDEAVVILKIETTGSAIPQVVYIYEWRDGQPELIWYFRTGDRADGGLKDIRGEDGRLVVELYGQDRFLLGETETLKITGDEEQLCCPTHFTRTSYRWNGRNFQMQGKRLTFAVADPAAPPVENMAELIEKQKGAKR
ncbi:MAG: hypothetical protein ACK4S4_14780 [Pyrinomonadaceae bacterium]